MGASLLNLVLRQAESLGAGFSSESDGDLLRRFLGTRDEAAFGELLRRHGPMVWGVCRHSLMCHAEAEDAFQATFLALIRSGAAVRRSEAVAGWLHGVALRTCLKIKRSAARRRHHEHNGSRPEADRTVPDAAWATLLAAVHEEVQGLPEAMRAAFVLCELEGVSQPDAARQLGVKPGTLTSRLTRARQRLVERLAGRGLAPAAAGGALTLGVATVCLAMPAAIIDKAMSLLNAGEAVSPAILNLASQVTPMTAIRMKLAAAAMALAAGVGAVLFPASGAQPGATEPPRPTASVVAQNNAAPAIPTALRYVPLDAAFFIHADVAELWNGKFGKSIREADANLFQELAAKTKELFGSQPEALKTATLFWPKAKRGEDTQSFGVVLSFAEPLDHAKLKAGVDALRLPGAKTAMETPSDRVAVVLVNLDGEKYGKPQPADKSGPLADAIREAGGGRHVISAGATLANLPDELRAANVPAFFKPFQPLFHAKTISAFVDLSANIAVEIRARAESGPKAMECEKSLGVLTQVAEAFLEQGLKEIKASVAKEPELADVVKVLSALLASVNEAKFETKGNVARVSAKLPAGLPYAVAFQVGRKKVLGAASRAQSVNNLKQIGLAMHNYASVHGSLPPAAVCDKKGKPLLSWRVLVLPYLEQQALYMKFKLDEPWDSEHNKKLIAQMPPTYKLPEVPTTRPNETHYRVFVGNDALFTYIKGPKFADISDGLSNTIIIVTAKDSVPWTKPDELEFDPEKDMTKLLGFLMDKKCAIGFADGSVRTFDNTLGKVKLNAMITKSGGEVVPDN